MSTPMMYSDGAAPGTKYVAVPATAHPIWKRAERHGRQHTELAGKTCRGIEASLVTSTGGGD